MVSLKTKLDALSHIKNLYGGPTETGSGDNIWLEAVRDFGIENLPDALVKEVAKRMLISEGEPFDEGKTQN